MYRIFKIIILIIILCLVLKENPTLTAAQTAKKISDFWKQLSSEERGYYRNIAQEEEKKHQRQKKTEKKVDTNQGGSEKNKSRLLQLFEKMKNTKNEKKEKLNMRAIIPWIIDRTKIITRLNDNVRLFTIYILYINVILNNLQIRF